MRGIEIADSTALRGTGGARCRIARIVLTKRPCGDVLRDGCRILDFDERYRGFAYWAGIVALIHAALVISLPRIILGLHYPSDILVGALVGATVALVLMPPLTRIFMQHRVIDRALAYPWLLYPTMFFVTFQSASMFELARRFLDAAADAVRLVL